jgi:hypothetical protein
VRSVLVAWAWGAWLLFTIDGARYVIWNPWATSVIGNQSRDLILYGLLTRLIRTLDDDLKTLVVLEQAGIKLGFNRAAGRGTGVVGEAYFLGDPGMEFEHGEWFLLVELGGDGSGESGSVKSNGRGCREAWAPQLHSTPVTSWGRAKPAFLRAGNRSAAHQESAVRQVMLLEPPA